MGSVQGYDYMAISRRLHEITGQLLQPEGYPYNVSKLLAVLDRIIEGRFLPEEEYPCRVIVASRDVAECLASLKLEDSLQASSILMAFKDALAAYQASRQELPILPYSVQVSVPRIPPKVRCSELGDWLKTRGCESACFEEACAYLGRNWAIHQGEAIVCLDGFSYKGQAAYFIFRGEGGQRIIAPDEIRPDMTFDPRYRVFARESLSSATR